MNMTLSQLIAKYNEVATQVGKPTRKSFDSKAKAEAAIKSITPKVSKGASLKIKKVVATREKGPRGFKFGPKWMQSIMTGKGIALQAQNLPKLKDTATYKGISITDDLTQAEIAAMIAKAG